MTDESLLSPEELARIQEAERKSAIPTDWARITPDHPRDGQTVWTKIDDADGERNVAKLRRSGRLWFFEDGSMYVYYTPTHWSEP